MMNIKEYKIKTIRSIAATNLIHLVSLLKSSNIFSSFDTESIFSFGKRNSCVFDCTMKFCKYKCFLVKQNLSLKLFVLPLKSYNPRIENDLWDHQESF